MHVSQRRLAGSQPISNPAIDYADQVIQPRERVNHSGGEAGFGAMPRMSVREGGQEQEG